MRLAVQDPCTPPSRQTCDFCDGQRRQALRQRLPSAAQRLHRELPCSRVCEVRRSLVSRPIRSHRGGRVVRPAPLHDGRAARRDRAREPRPRARGDPQFRLRVPAAPHHRQPGAGGCAQGRLVVRPADRARPARRHRTARRGARSPTRSSLGELSLDGAINGIRGVLPIAIAARRHGMRAAAAAAAERRRSRASSTGLEVVSARSLPEAVDALNEPDAAPRCAPCRRRHRQPGGAPDLDLATSADSCLARRALEVAAAGGHNLLLIGPPGAGKTMLARRLPDILPPLTFDEALECTAIHSVAGRCRPGRAARASGRSARRITPVSNVALVGGGAIPRPGEISLAHNGVLFLDEMPEFDRAGARSAAAAARGRLASPSRAPRGRRSSPPASCSSPR